MLAVSYGLEKFHQYTYGRHVQVNSDHKPLEPIAKKPLSKAPKRLQGLLLKCQTYNYSLSYKPGKSIPIADALSRSPVDKNSQPEVISVHNLSLTAFKEHRLEEIKLATNRDTVLHILIDIIKKGWPENKDDLPLQVVPYFSYRDELTVEDGIVMRGERIVIPTALRSSIKEKVHAGHLGINACLRRARELVFWPCMSTEIQQFIEMCHICLTNSDKQAPQPLLLHDIPTRPWERVGTDMFTIADRSYLVTVDYFSNFIEVDFLNSIGSSNVITKLKHHFARHGIPDILISDGGPQFSSSEFHIFATKWCFEHRITSPGNSKSNGCAEAAVKIAKKIMKRSILAKEDPYLGFLNYRNTPTEGLSTSPAQRLMGRRTRTLLPTDNKLLESNHPTPLQDRQSMQTKKYDIEEKYSHRRPLQPLHQGDTVWMQPIRSDSDWKPAKVQKQIRSRTYEVESNGRHYARNRQFLRKKSGEQEENPTRENITTTNTELSATDNVTRTRSGRVVKPVIRLNL